MIELAVVCSSGRRTHRPLEILELLILVWTPITSLSKHARGVLAPTGRTALHSLHHVLLAYLTLEHRRRRFLARALVDRVQSFRQLFFYCFFRTGLRAAEQFRKCTINRFAVTITFVTRAKDVHILELADQLRGHFAIFDLFELL